MQRFKSFLLIGIPFLVWLFFFRNFLTLEKCLGWDAMAYYEHVKFFVDNIVSGKYPFFEPLRDGGVTFELFSRRIGSYNPFFWIISILVWLKIPFNAAYMIFLAGYYFLGCVFFYRTLRIFFGRSLTSYAGYAFFLFSGIGLQVFYSYLIFIITPFTGFLFCLCAFFRKPRKVYFIGGTLALCILLQTYVPFYFLLVFLVGIILFAVLFLDLVRKAFSAVFLFMREQQWVVIICGLAILVALFPGWHLIQSSQKSEFIMPIRHAGVSESNQLRIAQDRIVEGGLRLPAIPEDILTDVSQFNISRFYIPVLVFIIFGIGSFLALTRRYAFWILLALIFFLLSLTDTFRGFSFFLHAIPFLQYFRNFEHFFYIAVIPALIMAVCELLYQWENKKLTPGLVYKIFMIGVSCAAHGILICYLYFLNESFTGTTFLLFISAAAWAVFFMLYEKLPKSFILYASILLVILPSTLAFWYADKNADKKLFPYRYETGFSGAIITYVEEGSSVRASNNIRKNPATNSHTIINPYLNQLENEIANDIFQDMSYKAALYTTTRKADAEFPYTDLAFQWMTNRGPAILVDDDTDRPANVQGSHQMLKLHQNSIKSFYSDSNSISFFIELNFPQFLVYNAPYSPQWEVWIDGKQRKLYRANSAFLGVWVPSGNHIIMFRYGSWLDYAGAWGTLLLFAFLLVWTIWECPKPLISSQKTRCMSKKKRSL